MRLSRSIRLAKNPHICRHDNKHHTFHQEFPGSHQKIAWVHPSAIHRKKRVEYCDTLITFPKRVNLLELNNYHEIIIIMSTEIAFHRQPQHTF